AKLLINGTQVGSWVFDAATTGAGTQAANLRTKEFQNVSIGPNGFLTLDVQSNATESGRIDYVELVRTDLGPNQAPTAVNLTPVMTTLAENANTSTAIKVADILIVDDLLGTNVL